MFAGTHFGPNLLSLLQYLYVFALRANMSNCERWTRGRKNMRLECVLAQVCLNLNWMKQRRVCNASFAMLLEWAVCVCVFFAFFTGLPNRAKNGANNLETCAMRWICKACFQRYLYAFYSVLLVKLYYFFFWNVFCATWEKVCFYKIILK